MIHIHQGGTLNTYCQIPLAELDRQALDWNDAAEATCSPCSSNFPELTA